MDEKTPPGRNIRCIISVAMLSEGWDANTVTHIVGLRPFGSQLLCEQVVGRALRRRSYALNEETDQFEEETAKVFGVPFELVPFKVSQGKDKKPPKEPNHIFSDPEKAQYKISFPIVEGYFSPQTFDVNIVWNQVAQVTIDPKEIPDQVELNSLTAFDGTLARFGPGDKPIITLSQWRKQFRLQQVAFSLAREVCKRWESEQVSIENNDSTVTPQVLFPKVAYAAKRFLFEKVKCIGTSQPCDVLLVGKYQQATVNSLYEAIRKGGVCGNLELPRIAKGAAGQGSTEYVDYHTTKPVYPVTKCHLNLMAADTKTWEQSAGFALDAHPGVIKWVKNEHLGFTIPYRKNGVPSSYIPDFIAELDIGLNLIIETKGQFNDSADIKVKAAERWVNAVNEAGNIGMWQYVIVKEPTALPNVLNEFCLAKWDASDFKFGASE